MENNEESKKNILKLSLRLQDLGAREWVKVSLPTKKFVRIKTALVNFRTMESLYNGLCKN